MAVIEVNDLTKTFKTRERSAGFMSSVSSFLAPRYRLREAVRPINFSLEAGETLAFIGPNGAGKSTTIKMLTGILHPSSGSARVFGLVPWEQRRALAFQVACVFGQKSQLWYHLPPQDTFDLLAKIYELEPLAYRQRRDFLVEVCEIGEYLRTPARKLSLGERMRCELAAALLHRPALLFLDEPTIGLDVIARQRIRDLIGQLNTEEGVTVFLTSHDAGDIEQVCRRAIVINHGEVILDTPVSRMKREYLKVKTVDLLLEETVDGRHSSNALELKEAGVEVLKAKGHGLKLVVDTAQTPLEPLIAGLMQRYHIMDMTIADPPMEEVIASIYNQPRQVDDEECAVESEQKLLEIHQGTEG